MIEKRRIILLSYEFPPIGGGAGIVFDHLSKQFVSKDFQVVVLTTWMDGLPFFEVQNEIEIYRVPSLRKYSYKSNPFEMFLWIIEACKLFTSNSESWKSSFILANFTIPGGVLAYYFKIKYKTEYIVLSHAHDIPWLYPQQMFIWHLFLYFLIRKILRESKYNVLLTQGVKDFADKLVKKTYKSKNVVIPNGLEVEKVKSFEKSSLLKIAFVGRMVEQKNPLLFLNVLDILSSQKIPFSAEMCGDGPLRDQVMNTIAELKLSNIRYLGKVSHSQSLAVITNANLLLVTSNFEGMSLVILEAIQAGTWVITTHIDGIENIIEEGVNGNIVSNSSANTIANNIRQYYYGKLKNGYQVNYEHISEISKKISWKQIANQYLNLFLE